MKKLEKKLLIYDLYKEKAKANLLLPACVFFEMLSTP